MPVYFIANGDDIADDLICCKSLEERAFLLAVFAMNNNASRKAKMSGEAISAFIGITTTITFSVARELCARCFLLIGDETGTVLAGGEGDPALWEACFKAAFWG